MKSINQLALQQVFSAISQSPNAAMFRVRMSYLEIYNEELRDLLIAPPQQTAAKGKLLPPPPTKSLAILENAEVCPLSVFVSHTCHSEEFTSMD